jgi:hypothetical protein
METVLTLERIERLGSDTGRTSSPLFLLFVDTAKIAPTAKRYTLEALFSDVVYLVEEIQHL